MSRIIKKLIKKIIERTIFIFIIGLLLCVLVVYMDSVIGVCIVVVCELVIFFLEINFKIKDKIYKSADVFYAGSKLRNVDALIIGDMVDVKDLYIDFDGVQVVELCAPDRTLVAAYEILRHTYSILKKNGKVIIACKKENVNKTNYSIFDIVYFHVVTIKRLNIESLQRKVILPLLTEPVNTVNFLVNTRKKYNSSTCPCYDIIEFCERRGLNLEYREL